MNFVRREPRLQGLSDPCAHVTGGDIGVRWLCEPQSGAEYLLLTRVVVGLSKLATHDTGLEERRPSRWR
jgi:hypothetical protein